MSLSLIVTFQLIQLEEMLNYGKNLPNIIELQIFIKSQFDYKLDVNAMSKMSVDDFIKKHWPKQAFREWNQVIDQYLR